MWHCTFIEIVDFHWMQKVCYRDFCIIECTHGRVSDNTELLFLSYSEEFSPIVSNSYNFDILPLKIGELESWWTESSPLSSLGVFNNRSQKMYLHCASFRNYCLIPGVGPKNLHIQWGRSFLWSNVLSSSLGSLSSPHW